VWPVGGRHLGWGEQEAAQAENSAAAIRPSFPAFLPCYRCFSRCRRASPAHGPCAVLTAFTPTLLGSLYGPGRSTLLVDRVLYTPWLFQRITRLGAHPFLRINTGGSFRPTGVPYWRPLSTFTLPPGTRARPTLPCICHLGQLSRSARLRAEHEFLQFLPEQREILPDILDHILAIKRRCWMITRQVFAVVVFDHTPSYLLRAVDAKQLLGGNAAKQRSGIRLAARWPSSVWHKTPMALSSPPFPTRGRTAPRASGSHR
jgi:hypothetical protein